MKPTNTPIEYLCFHSDKWNIYIYISTDVGPSSVDAGLLLHRVPTVAQSR